MHSKPQRITKKRQNQPCKNTKHQIASPIQFPCQQGAGHHQDRHSETCHRNSTTLSTMRQTSQSKTKQSKRLTLRDMSRRNVEIMDLITTAARHQERKRHRQEAKRKPDPLARAAIARKPLKAKQRAGRRRKCRNSIHLCGAAIRVVSLVTHKTRSSTSTAIYATQC